MWELDYKESWVSKNWCFWTVVLEKTLESPLDCKEIQPGEQSWVFTGSVTRVYVPQFFVLSQQRFGATDIKALGASQLLGLGQTMLQLLGKSVLQLYFI